jgi:hypothetical protein
MPMVSVKWQKKVFPTVEINTDQPALVFKCQLYDLTGVEQNIIAVASQVRNSLKASGFEEERLRYFDIGGEELLYELRILSATQRKGSAVFIIERRMSPKEACELARSVKDFNRRKNSEGFRDFTSAPGDCLAFAFYRQSRECQDGEETEALLQKALEVCISEKARAKIEETLRKCPEVAAEPEGGRSRDGVPASDPAVGRV